MFWNSIEVLRGVDYPVRYAGSRGGDALGHASLHPGVRALTALAPTILVRSCAGCIAATASHCS